MVPERVTFHAEPGLTASGSWFDHALAATVPVFFTTGPGSAFTPISLLASCALTSFCASTR